MSLATSIKDFADFLIELSAAKGLTGDLPKALLLQHTIVYSWKALISLFVYVLTFQWVRDISYLPLFTPQTDGASFLGTLLLDNPGSHVFSFSNVPEYTTDQLFAGFLNSFFFSLPVSVSHLISLNRLFCQGVFAAAASTIGIVAAHLLLLIGSIYGFRFLIIPYFHLEPFNYIIGVLLVAFLLKDFAQQKGFKLVPFWDKTTLVKMSVSTFVLTWCEEANIFHSLNNLTLNTQTSCLEMYPCTSALHSVVVHSTYIVAFFVGHCLFSAFFYFIILMASRYLASLRWFTTAMVTVRVSQLMLFLVVALTVSSFPYYGLDYLVTKTAGFLPEDPVYSNTLFSPTRVETKYPHFFKEMPPAQRDQKTPLNLDLNYWDRGLYLNAPKQQKGTVAPIPMPALSFEELNYQGEYAWVMRNQLSKDLSKMRPSVFTPMFKKPRRRYLQLRKLNDNRMEQAARVAHNKSTTGATTLSKEGILPGERAPLFIKMTDFLGGAFGKGKNVELGMHNLGSDSSVFLGDKTASSYFSDNDSESDAKEGDEKTKKSLKTQNTNSKGDETLKKMSKLNFGEKNRKKDAIKEELLWERKLNKTYSKGFAPPFSLPYERMRFRYLPVKNVIKKRYFLNNVYRTLLQTDIDSFLGRQPAHYKLAENQEFQLYKKREILQKYYNWLRYYEPIEKMMLLRFRIPDSRSFVDRVYHQQFKGTLKIARRLFKVSFDSQQNPEKRRVLSYDQMLYNDLAHNENPFFHEELWNKKDEEMEKDDLSRQPFFEETNTSPTYAGWDPMARRFVVTNRFLLKH